MASLTPVTLTIQPEYGYVILTSFLTLVNSFYHGVRVGKFRKAAQIPYPHAYADSGHFSKPSDASSAQDKALDAKRHLFNCAQRAHANFVENQTSTLAALLVAGLLYPKTAALMGLGWNLGRLVYAIGYTDSSPHVKDGTGRLKGAWAWGFQLGLFGLLGWTGVSVLRA